MLHPEVAVEDRNNYKITDNDLELEHLKENLKGILKQLKY